MSGKYLEDIVKEDVRVRDLVAKTFGSRASFIFDTGLARHPIISSVATYICAELMREKGIYFENAEESVLAAFITYNVAGLIKEYILEGRKFKARNPYELLLQNPKIAALIAMASLGMA